jgi:hypothetical protein
MSQPIWSSDPFGSSKKAFLQSAVISAVLLSLFFTISGEFSADSNFLILPFIFVPMAGGIAGLIFRNTTELREVEGPKKVMGWTIGILAYLILVPMGLVLGLNGMS